MPEDLSIGLDCVEAHVRRTRRYDDFWDAVEVDIAERRDGAARRVKWDVERGRAPMLGTVEPANHAQNTVVVVAIAPEGHKDHVRDILSVYAAVGVIIGKVCYGRHHHDLVVLR